MSFWGDLRQGQLVEDKVYSALMTHPDIVVKMLVLEPRVAGKDSRWDKYACLSIEVKEDRAALRTGNFAFEVYNPVSQKDTGLIITEAYWWVHVVGNKAYVFNTDELYQELYDNINNPAAGYRYMSRIGDGNSDVWLFKKDFCLKLKALKHIIDLNDTNPSIN